jgi:hypothetical protein
MHEKKLLYRKENTRTHGVRRKGGDWRWERHSKAALSDDRKTAGMAPDLRNRYDYTPLARFLLSRVGQNWTVTHSEAVSRLDREEPIWWLVARNDIEKQDYVRWGEDSYFSGLYVDDENVLRRVDPNLTADNFPRDTFGCRTFNGERVPHPEKGKTDIEDGAE